MAHTSCPSHQIEEVDLTADPEPKPFQSQKSHLNVQLCGLDRARNRKDEATVWYRTRDDSFQAIEYTNTSTFNQKQMSSPVEDSQNELEYTRSRERNFSPGAEPDAESNKSGAEMQVLESVKESLSRGDAAVKLIWSDIDTAKEGLAAVDPSQASQYPISSVADVMDFMPIFLYRVQDAHREIKQQLAQLGTSIKSLTESNPALEKALEQRKATDEKMLDSVKFLKQCLDSHANLVDLVMGRPQPLVKQGMELMQGLLDEIFGLSPGPVTQTPAIEYEAEDEAEVENRLEMELERQSDSEVEYLWEQTQAEDLMDIEASEASGSKSDESDDDEDDSISEDLEDYADDDNTSECSNYSTTILTEYGRTSRKRQEKRDKAKRARDALWKRFGLTVVEETHQGQDDMQQEDRIRAKRQKRNRDTAEEEPVEHNLTAQDRPPSLRQSTLSFSKVTKNRRLFSES